MMIRHSGPSDRPVRRSNSAIGVFVAIVLLQALLAFVSLEFLGAVRAFVAGESMYSKGQKEALIRAQAYSLSHDEADYQAFVKALAPPSTATRGLRALKRVPPDLVVARDSMLEGGNDPQDVPIMIALFRLTHDLPFMVRPIQLWSEGDELLVELRREVDAEHSSAGRPSSNGASSTGLGARLLAIDQRLTKLESSFTQELGHGARQVQGLLVALNVCIGALLALAGSVYMYRTNRARREAEAEVRGLIQAVGEAVLVVDVEGKVLIFNRGAEVLFGCRATAALGASIGRFILEGLPRTPGGAKSPSAESLCVLTGLRSDGHRLDLEASIAPLHTASGVRTTIVCRDVTLRHAMQERERSQTLRRHEDLARQALTDALTGLPNRSALEQHLSATLAHAAQQGSQFMLLFLDLDGFKAVNDTRGHLVGDELLRQVADRLREAVRRGDQVFRIGGDEFVIIVVNDVEDSATETVAMRILAAMREPYRLGDENVTVTGSLGVAVYPEDGTDARSLMRSADASMYRMKQRGKDAFDVGAR
jgi:diguanylate cyclase (GGDEF)-like protein/PAS domain S-box-containing protein